MPPSTAPSDRLASAFTIWHRRHNPPHYSNLPVYKFRPLARIHNGKILNRENGHASSLRASGDPHLGLWHIVNGTIDTPGSGLSRRTFVVPIECSGSNRLTSYQSLTRHRPKTIRCGINTISGARLVQWSHRNDRSKQVVHGYEVFDVKCVEQFVLCFIIAVHHRTSLPQSSPAHNPVNAKTIRYFDRIDHDRI